MLQGSPLALLLELVRPGSSRSRRRATDESEGESRSVVTPPKQVVVSRQGGEIPDVSEI